MSFKRSSSHESMDNKHDEEERNSDYPPMSRLFIICNKENTEEEIRENFESFGQIEDIWIVKNRKTNDNKSVAYIKFSKTSEAAKAMEDMNGTTLANSTRPIKVLVANSRHQGSRKYTENEEEKYLRLFVLIPRDMGEKELTTEFKRFGEIENVTIIRDKITKEGKGFGYVKFSKFSEAALAFENVDAKYKAVFAEPKPRNQSSGSDFYQNNSRDGGGGPSHFGFNDFQQNMNSGPRRMSNTNDHSMSNSGGGEAATLYVVCSPLLNQDQLWRLFDIVPGLDFCQISRECGRNGSYATVVYNNQQAAAYAREKYHGLEYPPGERLIVKTGSDVKAIGNLNPDTIFPFNNNDNGDLFCSVTLPPPAPMVPENTPIAKRCFIVCISQTIPSNILRNVFSRFGNLIDIYLLPNKNCGYAKYSNEPSCLRAIETLHGAEICGTRIKVMEAEELGNTDERRKRQRRDDIQSD